MLLPVRCTPNCELNAVQRDSTPGPTSSALSGRQGQGWDRNKIVSVIDACFVRLMPKEAVKKV